MNDEFAALVSRNSPGLADNLRAATVGIAGCGGLGSNIAVALARIGIGGLVLVDDDIVEMSNLNRQCYCRGDVGRVKVVALADIIRRINSRVDLETHKARLGASNLWGFLGRCDVIVEAFDTAEDKAMIMQAFADEEAHDKYLVAASGLAGAESSNLIQTRQLARNIFVCGDMVTCPDAEHGLMAPRVMIAAGHQANMVVRILAGDLSP